MDFDFSDEQYMFQDAVRGFLDDNHSLEVIRAKQPDTLDAVWAGLSELGIFSMLVPEAHGGLGLNLIDLALIAEEFGRAAMPAQAIETLALTDLIARIGTQTQKQAWLPRIAAGEARAAGALYEAGSGFDPGCCATLARGGQGSWRLSGTKIMVPFADSSDVIAVVARFEDSNRLGMVLIEPARAGVTLAPHETLDLVSRYSQMTLADVAITTEDVLGGVAADAVVHRHADVCAALASLQLAGLAGRVLDAAVDYAKQRVQFDKPIGSFQSIKHKCADMMIEIDAGRSAAYYAAWAVAEDSADRVKAVSMAKAYCSDMSRHVANEGTQIHGGMGFTWELGLHYYTRRAKVLEVGFGTAEYHRERTLRATLADLGLRD